MLPESLVWHVPFSPRKERFRNSAGAFSDVKRLRFLMRLPDITPDHRGNALFSRRERPCKTYALRDPRCLVPAFGLFLGSSPAGPFRLLRRSDPSPHGADGTETVHFDMMSLDDVPGLGGEELFKHFQATGLERFRPAAGTTHQSVHMPGGPSHVPVLSVGAVYAFDKISLFQKRHRTIDRGLTDALL